jgi:flavin-binding protein dodecin
MSIAKVIEVSSESSKSFDDAAKNAVTEVSKTVKNVKHIYIKDFEIQVNDDGSHTFRTNCKVTFLVNDSNDVA